MPKRHLLLSSVVLLVYFLSHGSGTAHAAPLSGVPFSENPAPGLSKFDSAVARLVMLARSASSESLLNSRVEAILAGRRVPHPKGMVEVWVTLSSDQELSDKLLTSLGIIKDDHYYHYRHFTQALVPLSRLEALGQAQGVTEVSLPPVGTPSDVISEGVARTNAHNYLDAGFRGQGIKIGILDRAFNGASSLLGSELPAGTVLKSFYDSTSGNGSIIGDGSNPDSYHGTACAEIVHDMAPDATLYLVNFDTAGDFAAAVQYLMSQNVLIISHSIGWFNTSFYDGTGPISSVVADAAAQGILWVNAAGNSALRHWEGTFIDPSNDGWNNFSTGDETIPITVSQNDIIFLDLTWDDWPNSCNNYDLYLFYESPIDHTLSQVASSTGLQICFETPTEEITYTAAQSGTYHIAIRRPFFANTNLKFELFSRNHDLNLFRVLSTSLLDPAPSANAFTVAAMAYNAYTIETFSSHGPTTRGATKPDITGPDGVSTASWPDGPFYGTSAATPHVAGAAADVWSQTPSQTATQVRTFLDSSAFDFGAPGLDNTYGYGMLNLPPLLNVAWTSPPPTSVTAGSNFQVAWSVTGSPDHINVHWNPTDPTAAGCCLGPVTSTNSSSTSPSVSPLTLVAPTQNMDGSPITGATTVRYVVHAHSSSTGATAFSPVASVVVSPAGQGGSTCYLLTLSRNTSSGGGVPTASPTNSTGCASGQYVAGQNIQLTASPVSGWSVGSWSGTQSDGSTSTTNSVLMPAANQSVSVIYIQSQQNGKPTVTTGGADGITTTSAMLHGTVNPNGLQTTAFFEYGTNVSQSVTSTAAQPMGFGTSSLPLAEPATGLACGTTYTYYAAAGNSAGSNSGQWQTFTTLSCPTSSAPSITAESFDGVTGNSAVLFASVSPNGLPTTAYFQYGMNPSVSVNGTPPQSISGSVSSAPIAAPISGLDCGTNYTYYAIGANSAGTTRGTFLNFTTWPCVASSPFVTSESADGITQTSAVLHGAVIPNGLDTYVRFAYGTNQSTSLTQIPPPAIDLGSGNTAIPFSASASGLNCGTTYFYYAIALNAATATGGPVLSFTTLPCGTSGGSSFYTLTPCRILDTRPPVNTPISASSGTAITIVGGPCGVPSTATAVALNVTAVGPTSQGILSVYPLGSVPPNYTVAFGAGQTRAASTVIGLSPFGTVNVFCFMPSGQGQTNFLIDVTGYFQ